MNKGLEALEKIDLTIQYKSFSKKELATYLECCEIIKKELKQAEENEKLLKVFKNALTIEHHEYPTIEHDDNEDIMSCFVKELYTIRQNELEKDMHKALRKWVLKNAFPKELKALEIIKRTAMKLVSLEDDTTICKKGRYAFYDSELYQSVDLTKEEYDLLKEVLL